MLFVSKSVYLSSSTYLNIHFSSPTPSMVGHPHFLLRTPPFRQLVSPMAPVLFSSLYHYDLPISLPETDMRGIAPARNLVQLGFPPHAALPDRVAVTEESLRAGLLSVSNAHPIPGLSLTSVIDFAPLDWDRVTSPNVASSMRDHFRRMHNVLKHDKEHRADQNRKLQKRRRQAAEKKSKKPPRKTKAAKKKTTSPAKHGLASTLTTQPRKRNRPSFFADEHVRR